MKRQYCIIQRGPFERYQDNASTLVSFAQNAMFKTFEELRRQNEPLSSWDLETAQRAKKKYAATYDIVTLEQALIEFNKYKSDIL